MNNLLTLNLWFGLYPPPMQKGILYFFLVIFSLLLLVGIISRVYSLKAKIEKLYRRAFSKVGDALITMGIFGLLLCVFAYEQIPLLSMRFFYVVWLIGLLFWAYFLYKYIFIEIPKLIQLKKIREQEDKWLPKPKSK
jgi:tellurite resistance protein TehA-like permease